MIRLLLLAFKQEQLLELYREAEGNYQYIKTYPFTVTSGQPGPKLREGDLQIPEGFYTVEYLNPNSKFHRSFKLNYPNALDKMHAENEGRTEPGTDIFIHGGAQSRGCIAIGDEAIEELYTTVENAGKENVQIVIAPGDPRKHGPLVPAPGSPAWVGELYDMLEEFILHIPAPSKS